MRLRFLFFFLLLSFGAFTQDLFQNISLKQALQQAKQDHKLIFLQFESEKCLPCNETADKAFRDPELSQRLQETFICLKISSEDADRTEVAKQYNIISGFGSFFIDQDGAVIHRFGLSTNNPKVYLKEIESVLVKAGEYIRISEIEKEYNNGNRDIAFLEMFLTKRKTVGLPTDQLLDEYATLLPQDSLSSVRTIQFIQQMAPIIESRAFKIITADSSSNNKAWRLMSPNLRNSINNLTVSKTLNKAIKEKNEHLALRAASFGLSRNNAYTVVAKMNQDRRMLFYYEKTRDTANYLKKAIAFYEGSLMTINPATVKRNDSLNYQKFVNKPVTSGDSAIIGYKTTIASITPLRSAAHSFMTDLNNGAWSFYKMTDNSYLLSLATEWAKRALEFYIAPAPLDTYARLLYKQGKQEQAIEKEIQAIELMKKRNFSASEYERVLEKMKLNAVNID